MPFSPPLSYVKGATDEPLLTGTIGREIARVVAQFPDREALVVRHQKYRATYAQFWDEVTLAAKGLLSRGIHIGDRVGIWSPNRYEWVITQFAAARVGAILVNLNPAYRAAELEYALNQSGTRLLILAEGFRKADYRSLLCEVKGNCPSLEQTLVLDKDWNALLERGRAVSDSTLRYREAELRVGDAINIQYTSGTTGAPKGATLSHANILNNGWFVGERMNYTEQDRICLPVPFYHCFGMVLGNLAGFTHGACLVLPAESFDPLSVLETVAEEKCTSLYGVPTMFIAELGQPRFSEFDLTSLRTGLIAGAPCPRAVMEQIRDRMHIKEITNGYGMTETSPISVQTFPDDSPEVQVATVGSAHPHVEVKIICGESGDVVTLGQVGELCTRGYSVMKGYWNDASATREAIDSEGWMHSGDLASLDEAGHVRIEGRLKDMIIRGGENIYPREVEAFLHTHPGVAEAQVVGVPSPLYGEEVMAWVRAKPGCELSEEGLREFCAGKIAAYKFPRYWKLVDSFPMTVTGKVQKFLLRERAAEMIASA